MFFSFQALYLHHHGWFWDCDTARLVIAPRRVDIRYKQASLCKRTPLEIDNAESNVWKLTYILRAYRGVIFRLARRDCIAWQMADLALRTRDREIALWID